MVRPPAEPNAVCKEGWAGLCDGDHNRGPDKLSNFPSVGKHQYGS